VTVCLSVGTQCCLVPLVCVWSDVCLSVCVWSVGTQRCLVPLVCVWSDVCLCVCVWSVGTQRCLVPLVWTYLMFVIAASVGRPVLLVFVNIRDVCLDPSVAGL